MVPFRNAAELEAGGNAAYLRLTAGQEPRRRLAALFQVNARGEPVEFTFNQMELPAGALWRADDLLRQSARLLTISLFEGAQRSPLVLLCLAAEVDPWLFRDDLLVQIPVCRVGLEGDVAILDQGEESELLSGAEILANLFWRPKPPAPESPPRRLLDALVSRGLLLEPFDRTMAGLEEALKSPTSES